MAKEPLTPVPEGPVKPAAKPNQETKSLWARLKKELLSSLTPAKLGEWMVGLGGRRFFLSLGAGVVTSVLVWYGKITPEIYRDVILGTVGIYIAGNTFQKTQTIKAGSSASQD